jgi:hypothetical protein
MDVAPGDAFQVRGWDRIGRRTIPQDGAESRDAVNPCFKVKRRSAMLVRRKNAPSFGFESKSPFRKLTEPSPQTRRREAKIG